MSLMKSVAFDTTFINALSGKKIGGAFGGADFNPYNKSETEIQVSSVFIRYSRICYYHLYCMFLFCVLYYIQRFCQSYMTEMSKYIGRDTDLPGMGEGVGPNEIGWVELI